MTDPMYNFLWVIFCKAIARILVKTYSCSNWVARGIRCLWLSTVVLLYYCDWETQSKFLISFWPIIRPLSNYCSSWSMLFCWSSMTNLIWDFHGETLWIFICIPMRICDCCNCLIWYVLWRPWHIMTCPICKVRKMFMILKISIDSWAKICWSYYYLNSGIICWWSNKNYIMDWFYFRSVWMVFFFFQTMLCTFPSYVEWGLLCWHNQPGL